MSATAYSPDDRGHDTGDGAHALSGWIVTTVEGELSAYAFESREDAIEHAPRIARAEHAAVTVIAPSGDEVGAVGDDDIRVEPDPDGWRVAAGEDDDSARVCPTKRAALAHARARGRREGRPVAAYYADGRFQRRYRCDR